MTERQNDTYTCAMCGGTFPFGWSDEEAEAEREANFPGLTAAASDIVCDDCFRTLPIASWSERWKAEEN